ncbi:hypothetical protein GCM10029992_06980 [Glycomyces albus]
MSDHESHAAPVDPVLSPGQLETYFVFTEAADLLQHQIERQLREEGGLSTVQFQILGRLSGAEGGRLTMTQLADLVVYSRSGLTYQVGLLEKSGLVTRGPSPDDERSTLVAVTDRGRALFGRILPDHAQRVHDMLFAPQSDEDVDSLREIMTRVRDHMRALPPRSAAPAGGEPIRARKARLADMVNEQMRENWNAGAAGWVENEAIFDVVFAPVTAAVLDAAEVGPGHRMLDVGCGSGTLLAAGVEAGASPVGVDIAEPMAAAARRRVPEADVIVADAQVTDLLEAVPGKPFDRVVSRFGVMFFDDPVAAFDNIRRACEPGARMVFDCWRTEEENPVFNAGFDVIAERLDSPAEPGDPNAPAPPRSPTPTVSRPC